MPRTPSIYEAPHSFAKVAAALGKEKVTAIVYLTDMASKLA